MILTTMPSIEGKTIEQYLGVVAGVGQNASGTSFADIGSASQEMTQAEKRGADAIVGVQITSSGSGSGFGSGGGASSLLFGGRAEFESHFDPIWCIFMIGVAVKLNNS